jgi:hypothetical protein
VAAAIRLTSQKRRLISEITLSTCIQIQNILSPCLGQTYQYDVFLRLRDKSIRKFYPVVLGIYEFYGLHTDLFTQTGKILLNTRR